MSAYLVLAPLDGGDDPEPHPDLVRAQRPDAARFMTAALVLGPFPERSYLAGDVRVSLTA